jgi:hypothetical protein
MDIAGRYHVLLDNGAAPAADDQTRPALLFAPGIAVQKLAILIAPF